MKTITNDYKNTIKQIGRELDSKVSYTLNGSSIELGVEELNSVSLHYEGNILKSVMKQLDIDSNTNIPIGTILTYQFGVKVNNAYEYINLGNFVVYSSEKQEDLNSYKIVCYDKLLYSMKDYVDMNIVYPITIRNYLNTICTYLGLTFKNASDTFPNYDKQIPNELYLDENGNTLEYTFRDVLDELAQVTASTICMSNDDKLELRYINDTSTTIDEEFLKDINVNFGEQYGPINTISFKRSADSDVVSKSIPANISDDDKIEISICDNQILNQNNRADYLDDILSELYGLTYYKNDFTSTGITFYELCDKFNITANSTTYPCIMLNDEINVTQGLEERIHTDLPDESVTDYNTASKDDRTVTRATLIVNKAVGEITATVQTVENLVEQINGEYVLTSDVTFQDDKTYYELSNNEYIEYTNYTVGDPIPANTIYEYNEESSLEKRVSQAEATLTSQGQRLNIVETNIDPTTGDILSVKRTNYELGQNGLIIDDGAGYKSVSNTTGQYYYDNENMVGKYTKDIAVHKDLALFGKYYYGIDEDLDVANFSKENAMFVGELYTDNNSEEGFGHFYNGG